MEYKIIRSMRKTLGLEISPNGVIIRAPLHAKDEVIKQFVQKHQSWIEKNLEKVNSQQEKAQSLSPLTKEEIKALAEKAKEVIPERVSYYAEKIGVTYGKITIRNQKTKWGSCSNRGNLNFNCLLMLAPPEVLDSVVVHELCHRKEMNHSDNFYAEVLRIYPDYFIWNKWLKDNGGVLIRRMIG